MILSLKSFAQLKLSYPKDTIVLTHCEEEFIFNLYNQYDYPLFFPENYVNGMGRIEISFLSNDIKLNFSSHSVQTKRTEWVKLGHTFLESTLQENCKNTITLLPGEAIKKKIGFMAYKGFEKGKIYEMTIHFSANDKIKNKCPYWWVGDISSNKYVLKWNSNEDCGQ